MIHFYCLAVEAGFYSDVVECRTFYPADRVRSPVGENVIWIFFLLSYNTTINTPTQYCHSYCHDEPENIIKQEKY